ncbi:hypothetical protein ABZV67_14725 [Streptomyces sp. NPDC005065]|uniref:hypothetical protein n=1 Tax=Streptomyces sp. NPDC005065 TaxID=3154461 RepID=UPI0033BDDFB9
MRKQALGEYAGVEVRAAALDHEGAVTVLGVQGIAGQHGVVEIPGRRASAAGLWSRGIWRGESAAAAFCSGRCRSRRWRTLEQARRQWQRRAEAVAGWQELS